MFVLDTAHLDGAATGTWRLRHGGADRRYRKNVGASSVPQFSQTPLHDHRLRTAVGLTVAYNYLRIVPADPKLAPSPEHDQSAVDALCVLGVEVAA